MAFWKKQNHRDRKQISLPGARGREKILIKKDQDGTLGAEGDGYILYLNYCSGYRSVHICQNSKSCMPKKVKYIVWKLY